MTRPRLLDFATQENYFSKVVERNNAIQPSDNGLDDAFASLSLDGKSTQNPASRTGGPKGREPAESQVGQSIPMSNELSTVLMAMRKIREAIVASARTDGFALHVYKFIIRATILLNHMESYHPALLHLLHKLHPVVPLAKSEFQEFLGYYILDLACRQDGLSEAYRAKWQFRYSDARVEAVLKALAHGNWCVFWMLQKVVTIHQRSLMEKAEDRIRTQALKCIAKSYLSVDKQYLEKSMQRPWEKIEGRDGMGWQLDGDVVTIKRVKKK